MLRSTVVAVALLGSLAAGCRNYAVIPDADRAAIDEARQGELLWLKQSMYVGQFYDDDRYKLVHPRRFEELTYLRTVEGDPITPPPAEGVVPAGTRVRIERIEWPTGDAVFRRPLYTPRYATWVFLRVARDRGDTTLERDQRHIMLLPAGIEDQETFDQWFASALSVDDPNPWLAKLPPNERAGIAEKRAVIGMEYEALTAALGFPDRVTSSDATHETALYGDTTVAMENGRVSSIDDGKGARAPATSAPSTEPAPPIEAAPSTEPAPSMEPAPSTEPAAQPSPAPTTSPAPTEPGALTP